MHRRLRHTTTERRTTVNPRSNKRPKLRHVRWWLIFFSVCGAATLLVSLLTTNVTLFMDSSHNEQQYHDTASSVTTTANDLVLLSLSSSSFTTTMKPIITKQYQNTTNYKDLLLSTSTLPPPRTTRYYSKPRIFLHVGPHKSATTTLQCALYQSSHLLAKDSMIFLGKVDFNYCGIDKPELTEEEKFFKKIQGCLLETDDNDCWHRLTDIFKSYHRNNNNNNNNNNRSNNSNVSSITDTIIFSKESLSSLTSVNHSTIEERQLFWNRLEQSLQDWNVTIVVTYRRYMEWLVSAKIQDDYHRKLLMNPPWSSQQLVDATTTTTTTMPSFLTRVLDNQISPPYPYVDSIVNYNWPSTWNIVLVNLHPSPSLANKSSSQEKQQQQQQQQPDIVTTFFCDILEADATCQFHQVPSPARTSPSDALVYNRLNEQAHQFGWWNVSTAANNQGRGTKRRRTGRFSMMTKTRRQYEKIWNHHSSLDDHLWENKNLFLDCPSPNLLERLLDRSLSLERQLLLPTTSRWIRYSPQTLAATKVGNLAKLDSYQETDDDHRERFWKNSTQQRYCSVNAANFLQQSEDDWKSYYRSV